MDQDHDWSTWLAIRPGQEGLQARRGCGVDGISPRFFGCEGWSHLDEATGRVGVIGQWPGSTCLTVRVMTTPHYVIVDGSNLATEGRMVPSLAQLEAAVQAYRDEDPAATIIVVVDATFGHRIDPGEKPTYDDAIDHGELLTPPAGAVGRGDGFILKIADKANAVILSNDSFQEFHGEYPWLFDAGRLVGGKPVPPIGWVFTPRSPVRGPKSRAATAKQGRAVPAKKLVVTLPEGVTPTIGDVITPPDAPAKRSARRQPARRGNEETVATTAPEDVVAAPAPKKRASKKASTPIADAASVTEAPPEVPAEARAPKKRASKKAVAPAVAAPEEAVAAPAPKKRASKKAAPVVKVAPEPQPEPETSKKRAPKKRADAPERVAPAPKAVNDAVPFLTFVTTYPIDAPVEGEVVSFTSHGAMVAVELGDGATVTCYAPTKNLGDPDAKSAKAVVTLGERYTFTVRGLDPARRVAELALS